MYNEGELNEGIYNVIIERAKKKWKTDSHITSVRVYQVIYPVTWADWYVLLIKELKNSFKQTNRIYENPLKPTLEAGFLVYKIWI